ncbi:MAG TPA: GntR family transcriptional regulator [Actinomycetales bacterium]|nr:GntR family transcriptional regulator [Actinomycetales bacterium]
MPVPRTAVPKRPLLRDDAYRRLRDAIVDGTLQPGERLRDAELGAWLGVSRTPVREALARLEQAGLVVTRPGRSTTVAPLDVRAVRDAQSVVASMHQLAVRLAVPRLVDDDLHRMAEANDRFAAALRDGDADAALEADDELHAVPVAAAANQALRQVLEQFTPLLRRVERLRFSSLTGRGSVALHADLIARCRAGDAEGAATVSWDTWQTLEPLLGTEELDTEGHASADEGEARATPSAAALGGGRRPSGQLLRTSVSRRRTT